MSARNVYCMAATVSLCFHVCSLSVCISLEGADQGQRQGSDLLGAKNSTLPLQMSGFFSDNLKRQYDEVLVLTFSPLGFRGS